MPEGRFTFRREPDQSCFPIQGVLGATCFQNGQRPGTCAVFLLQLIQPCGSDFAHSRKSKEEGQ
jgi:hypothetical protein